MEAAKAGRPERRIALLDVLRGFSILLMVAHHIGFDLISLGVMPAWVLYNAEGTGSNLPLAILHPVFAGTFIALSGTSSQFSRSNWRRGFIMAGVAVGITLVTVVIQMPIYFGIIHFLAVSTLLYAALRPAIDKIPRLAQPFLFFVAFLFAYQILPVNLGQPWLFWLGLGVGPESYDYFPLLKWFFIYLFGTWFGGVIAERKLPGRFYMFDIPPLSWIGRHSLAIYLLHQPVLFGLWWGLGQAGVL